MVVGVHIPGLTPFPYVVGLAPATYQRGFGQDADSSVKYKVIQLIASVRTVMRGRYSRVHGVMRCFVTLNGLTRTAVANTVAVPLIIINTLIIVYELILG